MKLLGRRKAARAQAEALAAGTVTPDAVFLEGPSAEDEVKASPHTLF